MSKYEPEITPYFETFYAVVVVAQIKFFAHYRYGAVARSISTSYWQMGTWLEKEKNGNEKI